MVVCLAYENELDDERRTEVDPIRERRLDREVASCAATRDDASKVSTVGVLEYDAINVW